MGRRNNRRSRIGKVIAGVFFIIGGIGNFGEDNGAALMGLLVGLALMAWYFIPIINEKKNAEKLYEQEEKEEEEAKLRIERELDERRWICERCGASTKGRICEYCDSPYEQ